MRDPYEVLGVPPTASDDEIRTAYRELARRYHPDAHQGSPVEDMAEEKMVELNNAYDRIMDMRRSGRAASGSVSPEYSEIRRQLQAGNITAADELLNHISARSAEWFFLKGTVCYNRGWLNEAYNYYSNAVRMEPSNAEYRAAFKNMNQARQGSMAGDSSPYRTANMRGCSVCDLCNGLICADCCCECFGGDLIKCC